MRRRKKKNAAPKLSDVRRQRKKHLDEKSDTSKDTANRLFSERKFERAVEAYSLAISQDKKDPTLYSNRSAAYAALGKFGKAFNDGETAVSLAPKWPKAHFRMGYAAERSSRYDEALKHYENGLSLCAEDSRPNPKKSKSKSNSKPIDSISPTPTRTHLKKLSDREILETCQRRVLRCCRLLHLESRIETDTKDPFYNMVRWLKEGGSKFPNLFMRRYRTNHRGVHALRDLDYEEEILYIPLKFIMSSLMAKSSSICKQIAEAKIQPASSHTWIAAFLLSEKSKNKGSFFYPYISILPEKFPTIPLFFGPDLLKELKGSFALDRIESRRQHLKEEYEMIAAKVPEFRKFSHDDFVWARLVVITRVFGIVVKGQKTDGLVPYADMLNHKIPSDTGWCYKDEKGGFVITTTRRLSMGAEVFDSYGRKCNHRFFVNYGFSLDENPENEAVLRVLLNPGDPEAAEKLSILRAFVRRPADLQAHQVPCRYDQKTKALFGFCRICALDRKEIIRFSSLMRTSQTQQDFLLIDGVGPVSIENERRVLGIISKAARAGMEQFETTIEHDEKLLAEGVDNLNLRNCIVMRLGEKKVLKWFIRLAEKGSKMLNMSFFRFRYEVVRTLYEDKRFDQYAEEVIEPLVKRERAF
ncbi:hypothetical protein AAMO2058_000911000 [Amorphochlora amoebiformis]